MLSRKQWSKLVALTTGHNALKRHLFICADPDDLEAAPPTCDLCEEDDQTSAHYLGECPALAQLRWDIFGYPFLKPPFDDLPINKVIYYMSKAKVQAMNWQHNNAQ